MRKNKLIMLSIVMFSLFLQTACQNNGTSNTNSNSSFISSINEGELKTYNIQVKSIGGKLLEDVAIEVYSNNKLLKSVMTDETGSASLLIPNGNYTVELENLESCYYYDSAFELVKDTFDYYFEVLSQVPNEEAKEGTKYSLKDVMYDFTLEDIDGNEFNLSTALEDFSAVVINFWATWCGPCGREFPYMNESYQKYKDEIALIAVSTTDKVASTIDDYRYDMEIDIPMAVDSIGLYNLFNFQGIPATVIVDRYGIISYAQEGSIEATETFDILFEQFLGDDYSPITNIELEDDENKRIPNVEMPSSDEIGKVINGEGFSASYTLDEDEEDLEYKWPWLISEEYQAIYPANSRIDNTAATIQTKITIEENKVFAFDYLANSEKDYDVLYVIIDGVLIHQISGIETEWKTCFAFVSEETKQYDVSLCYFKDSDSFEGQDLVYVNNLRFVDIEDINTPTYIYRYCTSGLNSETWNYDNYVTTYYNEEDGYYHVNSKNGPLVLAELIYLTNWSPNVSLLSLASSGLCEVDGKDYSEIITKYASYASNGEIGLTPVTQELKEAIQKVTTYYSDNNNEDEWLEVCSYYNAYGTNGIELDDPIKGLATFSAFEAKLGDQNFTTFTKPIIPRGHKFSFSVEESGVYKVNTIGDKETMLWIYDENDSVVAESTFEAREVRVNENLQINAELYFYFEANTTYYITPAFYDLYEVGTLQFNVEYVGPTYNLLTLASPLYYISGVDENGDMTDELFSGGIDVTYNETDGYYHELREDGTEGSIIYADFEYPTMVFGYSLVELIQLNGFVIQNQNGETEDLTMTARNIAANTIKEGELEGMVPVTQEVKVLLEKLITYYHEGWVENNWLKLCYYYQYYGPVSK